MGEADRFTTAGCEAAEVVLMTSAVAIGVEMAPTEVGVASIEAAAEWASTEEEAA